MPYQRYSRYNRNQIAPGIYSGSGAYVQRRYPKVYGSGAYYGRRVYGSGAYSFKKFGRDLKKGYKIAKRIVPKGTGAAIGSAIGGMIGDPMMGAQIGAMAARATGVGDYTVKENSLFANGIPTVVSSSGKGFIVRHREYLGNISTAADASFKNNVYTINPGLTSVFPWLGQIAVGFEEYRLRGMLWEYISTSSDSLSSTTTSLGSVILATQYDSSREAFQNQQQMANHEFANSTKPSCNAMHAIECAKGQTVLGELWVRTGAVPQGDDERFYDFGVFQIATVGGPSVANVIGEVWVSYEVEFLKPQLISGLGLQLLTDHWYSNTGVGGSNYFGTNYASAMNSGSNLGCSLTQNTIIFPTTMSEGSYQVDLYYKTSGAAAAVSPPTATPNSHCSLVNLYFSSSLAGSNQASTDGTATVMSTQFIVKINSQGAIVTVGSASFWGAGTISVDLVINQINGGIN